MVPSDVERIATVEGIRAGTVVAFAKRGSEGTDELYVVAAIHPKARARAEAIEREIRQKIHVEFGVMPRDVLLVRPNRIPKTSSGKIQRAFCRTLYESGELGRHRVLQEASLKVPTRA